MTIFEFAARTGYLPEMNVYTNVIEPAYYAHVGNKDEFCYDWLAAQYAELSATNSELFEKIAHALGQSEVIPVDVVSEYNRTVKLLALYEDKMLELSGEMSGEMSGTAL